MIIHSENKLLPVCATMASVWAYQVVADWEENPTQGRCGSASLWCVCVCVYTYIQDEV